MVRPITQEIMGILWRVVGYIEEPLELCVGDRILIDVITVERDGLEMMAPRRRLPRVLKINGIISVAFHFNSGNPKVKATGGNPDHAVGRGSNFLGWGDLD